MRFGLRLIGNLGTNRELGELARAAEEAGFDSVWFAHDTFMHNTWVLTPTAAEATPQDRDRDGPREAIALMGSLVIPHFRSRAGR